MSESKPKVKDVEEPEIKPEPPPHPRDYRYVLPRRIFRGGERISGQAGGEARPQPAPRTSRAILAALILVSIIALANSVALASIFELSLSMREKMATKKDFGDLDDKLNDLYGILRGLRGDLVLLNDTLTNLGRRHGDLLGNLSGQLTKLSTQLTGLDERITELKLITLLLSIDATLLPINATARQYQLVAYIPAGGELGLKEDEYPEVSVKLLYENGTAVNGSQIGPLKQSGLQRSENLKLDKGLYLIEIEVKLNGMNWRRIQLVYVE